MHCGQMKAPSTPDTNPPTSLAKRPQKLQRFSFAILLNLALALYDFVNNAVFKSLFGGHIEVSI